ncbi:MAG: hypothetical protein ACRYFX_14900 [Janthinobacterium lividum]
MLSRLNPQARALLLIAGTVLLLLVTGYALSLYEQHRTGKAIEATVQHHAARAAADTRAQQPADSLRYTLQGKRAELNRSLALIKRLDDSLRHALPAAPELPAVPPRL